MKEITEASVSVGLLLATALDISPEMLKLCRVTKVKVLFLVLVFVFNFNLFKFSAAILEKGL